MPNPGGVNNFNRFAPEPAYGQSTQEARQAAAAPVPPNPALGAPKRAQRRAVRGQPAPPPNAPPEQTPPPPSGPQPIMVAQAWTEIAQIPGASPLIQQIAAQLQGASGA